MSKDTPSIVDLYSLEDELLLPWLDLYETAFPAAERLLVSDILRAVQAGLEPPPETPRVVAAVTGPGTLVGLALYTLCHAGGAANLVYLATAPEVRNQGYGAWLYRADCRSNAQHAGAQGVVIEVEIPERAETAEGRALAERRIGFYRRLGARLILGIDYLQTVGRHQVPISLHVMVHPFQPMAAEEMLALAQGCFGEAISRSGSLALA